MTERRGRGAPPFAATLLDVLDRILENSSLRQAQGGGRNPLAWRGWIESTVNGRPVMFDGGGEFGSLGGVELLNPGNGRIVVSSTGRFLEYSRRIHDTWMHSGG